MASTLELDDRGVIVTCANCTTKNRLAYERLGDAVQCGQCKQPIKAPGEPIEVHQTADFDGFGVAGALSDAIASPSRATVIA